MKIMRLLLCGGALVIALGACSKKEDETNNPADAGCAYLWSTRLADEAMAISQAAMTYYQDSTQANCKAFKQAYQNYLDEAEKVKPCVPVTDQNEYQQAIDDARRELDDLPC